VGRPLVLLAYGFAVTNFTLAGDDWFAVMPEAGLDSQFALVRALADAGHLGGHRGQRLCPFFSFALALVLLTLAGALAAAAWRLTRPWAVFSVVALFVVNPLFTDALNTKPAHLSMPLAVVLGALAGWVLLRWRAGYVGRLPAHHGSAGAVASPPTSRRRSSSLRWWWANEVITLAWGSRPYGPGAWRRGLEVLVVGAAAIAVYLLTVRLSWWITGTDPRAGSAGYSMIGGYPSTPRQIAGTIRFGLRLTGRFWFDGGPLYPLVLKVVSLASWRRGRRPPLRPPDAEGGEGRRAGPAVPEDGLGVPPGAGLAGAPLAVIFLRKQPPTRASVFTTVGLVVGFWAALLFERVDPGGPRRRAGAAFMVAAALVLVVVLGSAYEINKGYFGLHLGNQRDLANANRMLSVMEQMPQFGEGGRSRCGWSGLSCSRYRTSPSPTQCPGPRRAVSSTAQGCPARTAW